MSGAEEGGGGRVDRPAPDAYQDAADAATLEWVSVHGASWALRNPVQAADTDRSWRIRFGYSKTVFIRELLRGVVPVGLTWLDVGCSAGAHMHTMRAAGQVCEHGCDVSPDAIAAVPGARVGDARDLPYEDASFDGVTMSGTLMHVGPDNNVVEALHEAARVARSYILAVELWQPQPMQVNFGDLMPQAWVYPWERVIPSVLSPAWTLERCRMVRTCGRLARTQPLMAALMIREPEPKESGMWGDQR